MNSTDEESRNEDRINGHGMVLGIPDMETIHTLMLYEPVPNEVLQELLEPAKARFEL